MIDIKKINLKKKYDIIVAGSGPSGIGAAIKAARSGATTLLIEWQGSIGGVSTTGLMSHFTGSVESSLFTEILSRAAEKNCFNKKNLFVNDLQVIDPEMLKITYYEMLEKAGVDILLYSLVCDTIMDGNAVVGVAVAGKSEIEYYGCKVIIDCTGDGDVAYHAGAEYIKGRENDGLMQPATLMFKVGGVDMKNAVFPGSFETTVETPKGELQTLAKKNLPSPAGHVLLYKSTIPGIVTCNMTNCTLVDGTKSQDLTRAELVCRKQITPIINFLRQYVPGYENCYIISAASLIGIRETRHFKGEYTINENDILTARHFDDWVVLGAHFNFDVHNISGAGLDKTGSQKKFSQAKGYTIPFGCLLPKKIEGLLLSGRNISGTHVAHSNFRAMPICLGIGEAAGTAAALSIKYNIKLREVDVTSIQKNLLCD